MPRIVILGTLDTKLEEFLFLRSQIVESGGNTCKVTLVDVGRTKVDHNAIDVPQDVLTTKYAPQNDRKEIADLSRGDVIKYMILCASNWLKETYDKGLEDRSQAIHGVISAGGTGGTSLASGVMRNVLPMGFPKLIVSTNASGDTGPVVGEHDISMTYSIVDIAGTNSLLRRILSNAAGAMVGMASAYERSLSESTKDSSKTQKKKVGLSMFGVTTQCVDQIRQHLESKYPVECYVFHSTGHGGKAMERLVEQGELNAVLDVTTTEICDYICGGVMSAGPHRLEAALKAGIPYIISVGATDMVNFGPKSTVPEKYQNRKLYEHNPTITLMRTSPQENVTIGEYIVDKIKTMTKNKKNVIVALPLGGVSAIATSGGPFHDADADQALFSTIKNGLKSSEIDLLETNRNINEEGFAIPIANQLATMMGFENGGPFLQ